MEVRDRALLARHDDGSLLCILVAPDEVGLLHRLRPVVRARPDAVLVRLDVPLPDLPAAQLGIARTAAGGGSVTSATWLGGLGAVDVEHLLTAITRATGHLPPALARRVLTPAGGSR